MLQNSLTLFSNCKLPYIPLNRIRDKLNMRVTYVMKNPVVVSTSDFEEQLDSYIENIKEAMAKN